MTFGAKSKPKGRLTCSMNVQDTIWRHNDKRLLAMLQHRASMSLHNEKSTQNEQFAFGVVTQP